jgi:hypothetical protein
MSGHLLDGPTGALVNLVDQVDFKALSEADRLRYLDVFDELITSLNERALQLQASIAVAEWRAQVFDGLGGVSA